MSSLLFLYGKERSRVCLVKCFKKGRPQSLVSLMVIFMFDFPSSELNVSFFNLELQKKNYFSVSKPLFLKKKKRNMKGYALTYKVLQISNQFNN